VISKIRRLKLKKLRQRRKNKMAKQRLECCEAEENGKKIKVYFCPKCRSKNVGYIFGMKNVFGIIPKMKCKKCKFEAMTFPLLVVSQEKIKKLNGKVKR
jgi:hypothetical protein